MQYLRRAIKYMFYFGFWVGIGFLFIFLYSRYQMPGVGFYDLFKDNTIIQLTVFIVAVGALYPMLGFTKKNVFVANLEGKTSDYTDMIINICKEKNYVLVSNENGIMKFKAERIAMRITRMMEDIITIDLNDNPLKIEGLRKDVYRIASALDYRIYQEQNRLSQKDNE